VSTRDEARYTAQAAKGKAARDPHAQAAGGAQEKKANLAQAGEKLKDTAQSNGRAEAMEMARTLIATSAAPGGQAARPHAGHAGAW
jgi:hypothetical protein